MQKLTALLAITSLLGTPAVAGVRDAAFASSADSHAARTSMFAGVTHRVGLDRRTRARDGAALAVTGVMRTPSASFKFGHGLEFSHGRTGKAALFLGGQDVGQFNKKAGMNGGTTAVIVGGLLLVAAVGAAVAISEATKCEEDCEPAPPN